MARFLGPIREHAPGTPYVDTAFRTILFTDIVGSTRLTQELGDRAAMALLRDHDRVVHEVVAEHGGSVVKHTGDGLMVSFAAVTSALDAATAIQRRLAERNTTSEHPLAVRIGLAAGEPVMEGGDLFGAAVQLAARLCDRAGASSILVSSASATSPSARRSRSPGAAARPSRASRRPSRSTSWSGRPLRTTSAGRGRERGEKLPPSADHRRLRPGRRRVMTSGRTGPRTVG